MNVSLKNKSNAWISVILIVVIGFIIRIYKADYSLLGDEYFTLEVSSLNFAYLIDAIKMDLHPPLFFLLEKMFSSWISGEIGLRAISLLTGTIAIIGMYVFCKEIVSTQISLFATLLTSISPLAISYSQEARQYSLFFALIVWSSYFLIKWKNENKSTWLSLFGIFSIMGIYTHYFYFIPFLVQVVWMFFIAQSSKAKEHIFYMFICVVLSFLPWMLYSVTSQLEFKTTVERSQGNGLFLAKQFAEMSVGHSFFSIGNLTKAREPVVKDILKNGIPLLFLLAGFGYIFLLGIIKIWKFNRPFRNLILGLLILPGIIPIVLNYLSMGSFLSTKYVIASYFPFLVLLSIGIDESIVRRKIVDIAALAIMAVTIGVALERYYYQRNEYGRWENWKECYGYVHNKYLPNDSTLIVLSDRDRRQIKYYLKEYYEYRIIDYDLSNKNLDRTTIVAEIKKSRTILMPNLNITEESIEDLKNMQKTILWQSSSCEEVKFGKRLSLFIFHTQ